MLKTRSEAGKLGYLKSRDKLRDMVLERTSNYYNNPKKCFNCSSIISYKKKKNNFCSRNCSAAFNNKKFVKRKTEPKKCLSCCSLLNKGEIKFCNAKCQSNYRLKQQIINIENDSNSCSDRLLKKYLIIKNGHMCSVCKLSEWNNQKIPLELEHIDGNSTNNSLNNLTILCPNCHAQTKTYKGKNIGNGRHLRRQRYSIGKSY